MRALHNSIIPHFLKKVKVVALSELNSKNYLKVLAAIKTCPPSENDTGSTLPPPQSQPYHIVSEVKNQSRHLTDQQINEIIEKYQKGATVSALAKEYDCHRATIYNLIDRSDVEKNPHALIKQLDVDQIIQMYHEQHTITEIAKVFGVGQETIRRRLLANNIKLRTRWDYTAKA